MTDQANAPAGGPLPRRGPRTWVIVLVGLVIVASGAIIGAGTTVLVLRNRLIPPPPPGEKMASVAAEDVKDRYGLTDEQAGRVREVMTRRMEAIAAVREESREKVRAEHDKLRAEMKEILTPDQFARWETHFESLRPPGFPPPPGPPGPRPGKGRPGDDRPMPRGPPPGVEKGPDHALPPRSQGAVQ
jgi:hypothetical protein